MSVIDTEIENTSAAAVDETATHAEARRQVSFSLRAVLAAVVISLLAGTAGVFGWLYWGAQDKLGAQVREAGNKQRAEEIAADYAVNAAEMDYQDFNAWKIKLVKGTSPELKDKLTKAADSMEQVLAPLQWESTAKPLATKVRSDSGGVYTVDSFVSVMTKTMQAPDGLQSTATYSITIDSTNNWQISDVGGIDAALGK
jgi:Mce-associated membrane protein